MSREDDVLRETLRSVRDWLASKKLEQWPYMEGGDFYTDREDMLAQMDAALGDHRK